MTMIATRMHRKYPRSAAAKMGRTPLLLAASGFEDCSLVLRRTQMGYIYTGIACRISGISISLKKPCGGRVASRLVSAPHRARLFCVHSPPAAFIHKHTLTQLKRRVIFAAAEGEPHSHCCRVQSTHQNVLHKFFLSAMQVVHADPRQHHQDFCLLGGMVLVCQQHSSRAVCSE